MTRVMNPKLSMSTINITKPFQISKQTKYISKTTLSTAAQIILAILLVNIISLGCFLLFKTYVGINYLSGCQGPETVFAMFPAFLLCIYLRVLYRNQL